MIPFSTHIGKVLILCKLIQVTATHRFRCPKALHGGPQHHPGMTAEAIGCHKHRNAQMHNQGPSTGSLSFANKQTRIMLQPLDHSQDMFLVLWLLFLFGLVVASRRMLPPPLPDTHLCGIPRSMEAPMCFSNWSINQRRSIFGAKGPVLRRCLGHGWSPLGCHR